MIQRIKEYVLSSGENLGEYLEDKFSHYVNEWKQEDNTVMFMVKVPGLSSPVIYKWEIADNSFYAINGKSIALTPELDKIMLEQEARIKGLTEERKAIYQYVKNELSKREDTHDGQVSDKDYKEIIRGASERFGIGSDEIESNYLKIEKYIYGLEGLE